MNEAKTLLLALAAALLVTCRTARTVPITGHKQNLMASDEQVLDLSKQEYNKYMASATRPSNAVNMATVKRVGQRLAHTVETCFSSHGLNRELQHYSWELNLAVDKQINVFCMPGDKVVVYRGLLPYTQDGPSLVVVIDHKIAHTAAHHSIEQTSRQIRDHLSMQVFGGALGVLGVGNTTTQIAQVVTQQGLQFRNLKYSHDHELGTDSMGLIFAAMAGYDLRVAVSLWQRVVGDKGNQGDMFSIHPVDARRIVALQCLIPTVLQYYNGGSGATATPVLKTNRKSTNEKQPSRRKTVPASGPHRSTGK